MVDFTLALHIPNISYPKNSFLMHKEKHSKIKQQIHYFFMTNRLNVQKICKAVVFAMCQQIKNNLKKEKSQKTNISTVFKGYVKMISVLEKKIGGDNGEYGRKMYIVKQLSPQSHRFKNSFESTMFKSSREYAFYSCILP